MQWKTKIAVLAAWLTALVISVPARADALWAAYVEAEHVHQSFEDGSANIETFTLAPSLQVGDWNVSVTLPWQRAEGSYFVNNLYPNLQRLCERINGLSSLQKLYLVRNGNLTWQQIQYCASTGGVVSITSDNVVQGFNDVEVFASYYLPAWSDAVNGSIGLGYKHDNGDESEGLGTGSRTLLLETNWMLNYRDMGLVIVLGYETILDDHSGLDLIDSGYGSLDARWQMANYSRIGCEYHYQQANAAIFEDVDYVTLYLQFGKAEGLGVRLFLSDYRNAPGYPDQEFGGSISYAF